MAPVTDYKRTAEFVVSEANGYRSRSTQEFDSDTDWADAEIPAGQVYAIVSSAAVPFDGDASDGSEVAAGILYEKVDALETATKTVITRDAEVELAALTADGTDAEVIAALAALGIVAR
jgi:hypothetical protein